MSKPITLDSESVVGILRRHRSELHDYGIRHLGLVGSLARGEASEYSDVDLFIEFDPDLPYQGFEYFGHIDKVREHLSNLVGSPVDILIAPVRKPHLQRAIERDQINAF